MEGGALVLVNGGFGSEREGLEQESAGALWFFALGQGGGSGFLLSRLALEMGLGFFIFRVFCV